MGKIEKILKEIDDFNRECPVGTPVIVTKDSGEEVLTKVRYAAQMSNFQYPVVWLDNISGYYLLSRVRKVTQ